MRRAARDRLGRRAALILAAAGMIPLAGQAAPVYFNDFESGLGTGWSGVSGSYSDGSGIYTDLSGQSVLGLFYRNETVRLTLPGIAAGDYTVSFDFFTLYTWDGNGEHCCGRDGFIFRINGSDYVNATFAMSPGAYGTTTQGYTDATPLGGASPNAPGGTDADASGVLDLGTNTNGEVIDSLLYEMSFAFSHPGGDLVLEFAGNTNQPGFLWLGFPDEPWAIDNLMIASAAATPPPPAGVPAPGVPLLLTAGLLGWGLARRRRGA